MACEEIWIWIIDIGYFVSIACLGISFIICMILSDLRQLYGYTTLCLMLSLFFTYICNSRFVFYMGINLGSRGCTIASAMKYFATLNSIFWFSVICAEINRYFRYLRHNIIVEDGKLRIWHGLYAVLYSAIFACTISMLILPQFEDYCWFLDARFEWYFYDFPILMISIMNMVLFILTSFDIYIIKTELAKAINDGRKNEVDEGQQQKCRLFFKLWIMMGLPITIKAIEQFRSCIDCYCLAISALNAYHGLYFFIVFICNNRMKKNLQKLVKKYSLLKKKSASLINTMDADSHLLDVAE